MCDGKKCGFWHLELVEEDGITMEDLLKEIKDLREIIQDERKHQELIRHELKDLEMRMDIIQTQINSIK